MIKNLKHTLLIAITACLLQACANRANISEQGEPMHFKYATNLKISQLDSCIVVELRNPWDTARLLHAYVLVPADSALPHSLPAGTLVRTPVRRALVYTSVHTGLLVSLGALNQIAGVCDAEYLQQPIVRQRIADGLIVDAGNAMSPDIERVAEMHPDAVLLSPFENGGYGPIEKMGIPIVECADYMEVSPLACAEWMRFYGLLFGRADVADSLFSVVERNYCSLRDSALQTTTRPTLLTDLKTGAAWYVPGGCSTTGRFYTDAGANYLFADFQKSGAVPLAFETVFERANNADFWLFKYNRAIDYTYAALAAENDLYTQFTPFGTHQIYGCNTSYVPYYDEVPFRPDWFLRDLVRIFHPELLPDYETSYFSPLE